MRRRGCARSSRLSARPRVRVGAVQPVNRRSSRAVVQSHHAGGWALLFGAALGCSDTMPPAKAPEGGSAATNTAGTAAAGATNSGLFAAGVRWIGRVDVSDPQAI